ncbi:MAG: prolyl oligopeptidase family serine peptidase, partial [Clostridia bacterium]|nr:prolyl oligopeptidase family serine peptidase [Clostridia bacterium]
TAGVGGDHGHPRRTELTVGISKSGVHDAHLVSVIFFQTTTGGVTFTMTSSITYTWNGSSYDVTKGIMWDTQTLFNIVPEQRAMPELNLGANISAFKFKASGTETKTETWVFGAVGVPTSAMPAGGYPAVVLVHGGAGYVRTGWIEYWNKKGFVAIAIDMWGNQLDANGNKVSNPDSGFVERAPYYDGVENPEYSWVYHSVYNVIMAHNIVRARADVNAEKTAITGISWGGYITSIVSGVDTRFKAVAPVYGCGYIYEDSFWLDYYRKEIGTGGVWNSTDKQAWISLYDPSSYVGRATAPMMFVSGQNDTCFSTTERMRTADLYKGPKAFYSQRYGFDHGDYWEVTYEIYAFFRHILYGEDTLSDIQGISLSGNVATLNYSNAKFGVVNFVYTTSTDADSHKWTWQAVTVTAVGGVYSFTLPAGTTAYYFETMTTDDTLHQSTKIMFT